jgi:hypothetical protein
MLKLRDYKVLELGNAFIFQKMIAPGCKFSIVLLQAKKMDLLTLLEVFLCLTDPGAIKANL